MEISTFSSCALVEGRLLRAVIGLAAGILDEKSERREKGDGVDVRAGFGSRKKLCVFVQEGGHGIVAALAEEIRFADGLVGERRVESESRRGQKQRRREERQKRSKSWRHG